MKLSPETRKHLAIIGSKGGQKTMQRYGKKHLSKIGKKGYKAMKAAMEKKLKESLNSTPVDKSYAEPLDSV